MMRALVTIFSYNLLKMLCSTIRIGNDKCLPNKIDPQTVTQHPTFVPVPCLSLALEKRELFDEFCKNIVCRKAIDADHVRLLSDNLL